MLLELARKKTSKTLTPVRKNVFLRFTPSPVKRSLDLWIAIRTRNGPTFAITPSIICPWEGNCNRLQHISAVPELLVQVALRVHCTANTLSKRGRLGGFSLLLVYLFPAVRQPTGEADPTLQHAGCSIATSTSPLRPIQTGVTMCIRLRCYPKTECF